MIHQLPRLVFAAGNIEELNYHMHVQEGLSWARRKKIPGRCREKREAVGVNCPARDSGVLRGCNGRTSIISATTKPGGADFGSLFINHNQDQ